VNTKKTFLFGACLFAAAALSAGSAKAAFIAGIDMDYPASGGVYYTEPGFASVPTAGQDYNVTTNGITFDLNGTCKGMANRYRNQPAFPLETDFAQWWSSGGTAELECTFSGLEAEKEYTVTFWTYNMGAGQTTHDFYEGEVAVENLLGTFTTSGNQNDPDNWVPSVDWDLTSDANGMIVVNLRGGERITVDGIAIAPEPATMGLLALGGLAALRRRRRA